MTKSERLFIICSLASVIFTLSGLALISNKNEFFGGLMLLFPVVYIFCIMGFYVIRWYLQGNES